VDGGNWRGDAWPKPDARARQRLPRVEDLPAAEHGYDREGVREAFDSFYRHIAQLDATVRALEAVEVFRDQAGELRKELRALKAAGWTQQPWSSSYTPTRVSAGLPESLPRFAIEAAFLIVVAVVVAVAGFDRLSIVLVMALAWAIVGIVEWAASREHFARARVPAPARPAASAPAPLRIVPAAQAAALPPAESWEEQPAAVAVASEEERTVIRPAEADLELEPEPEPATEVEEPEPVLEQQELEPEAEAPPEPEAEPEPQIEPEQEHDLGPELEPDPAPEPWSWAADVTVERARDRERAESPPEPRRRFWQRRRRDPDGYRFDPGQPRHVRVLPPEPSFDEQFPVEPADRVDPWEQELDLSIEEPEGSVDDELSREREAALDRGEHT
jgi:hypothetical protein